MSVYVFSFLHFVKATLEETIFFVSFFLTFRIQVMAIIVIGACSLCER